VADCPLGLNEGCHAASDEKNSQFNSRAQSRLIGASDLRVTTAGNESADMGDLHMSLTCIICLRGCPY